MNQLRVKTIAFRLDKSADTNKILSFHSNFVFSKLPEITKKDRAFIVSESVVLFNGILFNIKSFEVHLQIESFCIIARMFRSLNQITKLKLQFYSVDNCLDLVNESGITIDGNGFFFASYPDEVVSRPVLHTEALITEEICESGEQIFLPTNYYEQIYLNGLRLTPFSDYQVLYDTYGKLISLPKVGKSKLHLYIYKTRSF